jgi:predicted Zn finger-like uncharacterized protein
MLITTCSSCTARFRVTPQQLNERQGQVRCGRCRKVFNGFEALERFPDDDTGTRLLAAHDAAAASLEEPPSAEPLPDEELPEIESVDAAPPIDLPVPETATPAATRRDLRGEELSLDAPTPRRPSRAWRFGVALMLVVLGVEGAYAFRAPLVQRYPVLRQPFDAACAPLGCTVPWSREEGLLKLEESEMLEVPGKPNEIALAARIRNLASVAQEYPHLELTMSDFTGQPAARRVLRPTDYLGRPLVQGDVMAPGAEIALQLRLETPRIKPTGYELLLFYP